MLLEDLAVWLRKASWTVVGLLALALLFVFGYVSQDTYAVVDEGDVGPLVAAVALFFTALGVGLAALLQGLARLLDGQAAEQQAARRAAREARAAASAARLDS